MTTRAPSRTSAVAVARPIPRAAPVMTISVPCSDRFCLAIGVAPLLEPARELQAQHLADDLVALGVARERVQLLAHVELLARRRLRARELTQAVVTVEPSEATVADTAERQRRNADEREHRVDRRTACAQLRGDLATTVLR